MALGIIDVGVNEVEPSVTVEPATKLLPVIVNVVALEPSMALVGDRLETVGRG